MQSVKNIRVCVQYIVYTVLSLTHSMPERGSLGLRFFSHSKSNSLRRQMKSCLSAITMKTRSQIDRLNRNEEAGPHVEREREYLLSSLRYSSTVCTTVYVCVYVYYSIYTCKCVCVCDTINSLNHSHTTIIHSYSLIYTLTHIIVVHHVISYTHTHTHNLSQFLPDPQPMAGGTSSP